MSFDGLDLFDYESDNDGSGSGYPGTCAFSFFSEKLVVSVSCLGSGLLFQLESSQLVTLLFCLSSYQEESSTKVVDS